MSGIGEQLRQARLARGIGLQEIASETRISSRYLEALEKEDFKTLPGALFARNFARQYAAHVGLDPSLIEQNLEQAFPKEPDPVLEQQATQHGHIDFQPLKDSFSFDSGSWRRARWSAVALVAVLGAGSAIYMGWQELGGIFAEARLAARTQQSAEPAAAPTPTSTQSPAGEGESQEVSLTAANPAPGTESSITISADGMAVQVVASEATWVSMTANGKQIFSGILEPNQRKLISGVARAKLVVGNAGGIEILTNGKSIGPIGPSGQVRVVILSPDGPQILRKAKTPAESDSNTTASTD